jgi:ribosomal protein S6
MEETEKNLDRVYELSVLLVPTLEEGQVPGTFGDIKALLESKGAVFITEDMPKVIELAYEMSRTIENKKTWFGNAYFGWVKFEIDPSVLSEIKETLSRNEKVIRFLTLKTVRENTIASKKGIYSRRRDTKVREDGVEEPKPEINEAQVDAEIDALVSE